MKDIGIKIVFLDFEDNYIIQTDQKRLQQVLLNLFSNAIKYTDRRGKVEITAKFFVNSVQITVKDSGIGILKENQDKLFKLFCSIKDEKRQINTNGIGLGLVIS